jgi:hypothetical protein
MQVSGRQLVGAMIVSFSVGALSMPVRTQGQGAGQSAQPTTAATQPTFMLVEFMRVSEGKESDWLKLERETWKPMHALRIKDGSIKSWAAIGQAMPGDESNGPIYATVTTFRGWPDPTKTDWEGLFKKAHPQGDVDAVMKQTGAARRIVRSEVWQVLEQSDLGMTAGTK